MRLAIAFIIVSCTFNIPCQSGHITLAKWTCLAILGLTQGGQLMNPKNELFKSQHFFRDDLHIAVNRFTESFDVPYHKHDFIEYCYVAEGSGFHHIDEDIYPIHKGMLFVVPLGVSHVFRPSSMDKSSKAPIVYNCLLDTYLAEQLSVMHDKPIRSHLMQLRQLETAKTPSYFSVYDREGTIESIMQQLHREIAMAKTGSKAMLYALLNQLIITVYRYDSGDQLHFPNTESNDFQSILDYVEKNYGQSITLLQLSQKSGWSTRQLQRLFHKYTEQSFGSFLQQLRIKNSCEMLRNSNSKISTIANAVGYRNVDAFNSVFKKTVGLTPSRYRN